MDWNNIDLNSHYELSQDILDGYDCDTLLLECACNLREITPETVRKQAILSIQSKYNTAIEILEANLNNLVAAAKKEKQIN